MDNHRSRPCLLTVLGTRPEIIKCSTLLPWFDELYEHVLVHTGQHYDEQMDANFFRELGLRHPDVSLAVGSVSHAEQLARMLVGIESVLIERRPDLVFVQGDTNSTLAGGLAAAKLNIPVVHLEAGCRSFNRRMPEEINRVVVDHIAEVLLAPDELAATHLQREGIMPEQIVIVGSTAIDACLRVTTLPAGCLNSPAVNTGDADYLVVTIHRAENTTPERLPHLILALEELSASWPVIFPVHPRTAKALAAMPIPAGIHLIEPLGYAAMMRLVQGSRALLTDSGGLQEEAAILGTPTFVLREETEWRSFVDAGHHQLVGTNPATIVESVRTTLTGGEREQRMRQPIGRERAGATDRVLDVVRRLLTATDDPASGRTTEGQAEWNLPTSKPGDVYEPHALAGVTRSRELEANQ